MSTSFDVVCKAFFKKLEQDPDFFNYYNLTVEEALELATERADTYLDEAIAKLTLKSTPDVNFNDYDRIAKEFPFDLTTTEIDILASLMYEMYLEKDVSKLKVQSSYFTSQDLGVLHSRANERKTFTDMFKLVQAKNDVLITNYDSKDRITGKRKKLNHALYQD